MSSKLPLNTSLVICLLLGTCGCSSKRMHTQPEPLPGQHPYRLVAFDQVRSLEVPPPAVVGDAFYLGDEQLSRDTAVQREIARGPFGQDVSYVESPYRIERGDRLEIKFRSTTELNETVTVRPDGMIALQVVGEMRAEGLSPEELRQDLIAAYSTTLKNPELVVLVQSYAGNMVYVGGEVLTPGRVLLTGNMTLLQSIITAGGFKETADAKRVMVRRADGSCCQYDIKSAMNDCNYMQDVALGPHDTIYVPRSCIAKVNLFVDQYINKVLPFDRSFGIFVSHATGLNSGVVAP